MGTGPSRRRYVKNGWKRAISKAVGVERAEEELIRKVTDDENHVRVVVKTYKWSHDGSWIKDDYEPVIWFYERGSKRPSHAISFSHYGKVLHRHLESWNANDFSPRFPNEFHTPILKAREVRIVDGALSRGAYAYAKASLYTRKQESAESSKIREGLPPASAEISKEVKGVVNDWRKYWDELQEG